MRWSSKSPPGSVILWEDSQDAACSCTHSPNSLQQNQQTEKHMGQSPEEARHKFLRVLSPQNWTGCVCFSSIKLWQYMWNVSYKGSSLETQSPRFLLEAGHVSTFSLACAKVPGSQEKKQVFSIYHIVYTNNLGTVSHTYQLWSGVHPP